MGKKSSIKIGVILRWVLIAIISVAVGFGAYSWNAKSLANDALPMPLGVGVAVVLSGSMEPELSVDDVIVVVAARDYEAGDVVVFQNGNSLTVHEIIAKEGDVVTTKGTANNTADDPINIEHIKGRVLFSVDGLGKMVYVIRSPLVTLGIIVIAVILLVMSYQKEKEEEQKDLDGIRREIERLKNENEGDNSPQT